MNPSISVVIPLYNKAPHIRETLESVFAQTYPPDEVVVVDDGSTDNGFQIVSEISNPKLILVKQENQGVSKARNTGIGRAQGDYVAFLDADDFWNPNHLEELAKLIVNFPDLGLYSTAYTLCTEGRYSVPISTFPPGFFGIINDFLNTYANNLSLVSSSTACVNRESIISIGCFPENIDHGEDTITWVNMALRYRMAHSSLVTSVYNQDASNRASNKRDDNVPTALVFLSGMINQNDSSEQLKSGAKRLFSRIAFYTSASKRESGEWKSILNIIKLAKNSGMWMLVGKISIVALTPSRFLKYAKRWRRKKDL